MNRREFLGLTSSMLGAAILSGCERDANFNYNNRIALSPFSATQFHSRLEVLRHAYEEKGMHVSKSLRPPVSEQDLVNKCRWFPGEIVPEIIALYGWHEGQEKPAWEERHPFWFRDNAFLRLSNAEEAYNNIMTSYGLNPMDHFFLKYAFPFAAFNGAWYVIPTREHPFGKGLERPVISVFEGIDVFYYSVETMVNTCIDWVRHKNYTKDGSLPNNVEMAIWRKHNPGIFEPGK